METRLLGMAGMAVLSKVDRDKQRPQTVASSKSPVHHRLHGPRPSSTNPFHGQPAYIRMLLQSHHARPAAADAGAGSGVQLYLVTPRAGDTTVAMRGNLQRVLEASSRSVLSGYVADTGARSRPQPDRYVYVENSLRRPLERAIKDGRIFATVPSRPTAGPAVEWSGARYCFPPLCVPPTGGAAALARLEFIRCMDGGDPTTFAPFLPGVMTLASGIVGAGLFGVAIRVVPSGPAAAGAAPSEAGALGARVQRWLLAPAQAASSAPGCLVCGLDRAAARSLLPHPRHTSAPDQQLPPIAGALFPSALLNSAAARDKKRYDPRRMHVAPHVPAVVLKANKRTPLLSSGARVFNQFDAGGAGVAYDWLNPYACPLQTVRLSVRRHHGAAAAVCVGHALDECFGCTGTDSFVLDITTIFLHADAEYGAVVCESVADVRLRPGPMTTSIPLGVGGLSLCMQRAVSKGCGVPSVVAAMDAIEPVTVCYGISERYGCVPVVDEPRVDTVVTIASLLDLTNVVRKNARVKNAAAPWLDNDLSAARKLAGDGTDAWAGLEASAEPLLQGFAARAQRSGLPASSVTRADIEAFVYRQVAAGADAAWTGPGGVHAQRSRLVQQLQARGVKVLPSASRLRGVLDVTHAQGAVLGLLLRKRALAVTAADCAVAFQQMERLGMRHTDALVPNVLLSLWPGSCERALCFGAGLRAPRMPVAPGTEGDGSEARSAAAAAGGQGGGGGGLDRADGRATEVSLRAVLVDYGTTVGVAGPLAMHGEVNLMIDQLLFSRFPAPAWTEDMAMLLTGILFFGSNEAARTLSIPGALEEAADALGAAVGELRRGSGIAVDAEQTVLQLRGAARVVRVAAASGLGASSLAPDPFGRTVDAVQRLRRESASILRLGSLSERAADRLCRACRMEWPHVSANDGVQMLTTAQSFPLVCRLARDVHKEAKVLENVAHVLRGRPENADAVACIKRAYDTVSRHLEPYHALLDQRNGMTLLWAQRRGNGVSRSLRESVLRVAANLGSLLIDAGLGDSVPLKWSAVTATMFDPFVEVAAPPAGARVVDQVGTAAAAAVLHALYPDDSGVEQVLARSMLALIKGCGDGGGSDAHAAVLRVLLVASALRMRFVSLADAATHRGNTDLLRLYLGRQPRHIEAGLRASMYAAVCRATSLVAGALAGPVLPLDELETISVSLARALSGTAPGDDVSLDARERLASARDELEAAAARSARQLKANGPDVLAASDALGRAMQLLLEHSTGARAGDADYARRVLARASGLLDDRVPVDGDAVLLLHSSPWVALLRFVRTARATAVSSRARHDVLGADPLLGFCREYASVEQMLHNVLVGVRAEGEAAAAAAAAVASSAGGYAGAGAGAGAAVPPDGSSAEGIRAEQLRAVLGTMHALPTVRGRSSVSAVAARSLAQASGAAQPLRPPEGQGAGRRAVSIDGKKTLASMLAQCVEEKQRAAAASATDSRRVQVMELETIEQMLRSGLTGVALDRGAVPGAACCPVDDADLDLCAAWVTGETLDALLKAVVNTRMMRTSPPPSWTEMKTLIAATGVLRELKDIVKERGIEGLRQDKSRLQLRLGAVKRQCAGDALPESVACFVQNVINLVAGLPLDRMAPTFVGTPAAGTSGAAPAAPGETYVPSLSVVDFCRSAPFRSLRVAGAHDDGDDDGDGDAGGGCSSVQGNYPLLDTKVTASAISVQRARAAARALVDVGLAFTATVAAAAGTSGGAAAVAPTRKRRAADHRSDHTREGLYRATLHTGPICGVTGRRRYALCTDAEAAASGSPATDKVRETWDPTSVCYSDSSFFAHRRAVWDAPQRQRVLKRIPRVVHLTPGGGDAVRLVAWNSDFGGRATSSTCTEDLATQMRRCCAEEDRTIRVWSVVEARQPAPSGRGITKPLPRVLDRAQKESAARAPSIVPFWDPGSFVFVDSRPPDRGHGAAAKVGGSVGGDARSTGPGTGERGHPPLSARGRWQGAYNYVCLLENLDMLARGGSRGYVRGGLLVSAQSLTSPLSGDVVEVQTHQAVNAIARWLLSSHNKVLVMEALAPFAALPVHMARAMRRVSDRCSGEGDDAGRLRDWGLEIEKRCLAVADFVARRSFPSSPHGRIVAVAVLMYCMGASESSVAATVRDRWTLVEDRNGRLERWVSENHEGATSLRDLLRNASRELGCARIVCAAVEDAKAAVEHSARVGEEEERTRVQGYLRSVAVPRRAAEQRRCAAGKDSVRVATELVRREAAACASLARAQTLVDMELTQRAAERDAMKVYALLRGSAVAGADVDGAPDTATVGASQSPQDRHASSPAVGAGGASRSASAAAAAADGCTFAVQPPASGASTYSIVPTGPQSCRVWRSAVEPQVARAVQSAVAAVSVFIGDASKKRRVARVAGAESMSRTEDRAAPDDVLSEEDLRLAFEKAMATFQHSPAGQGARAAGSPDLRQRLQRQLSAAAPVGLSVRLFIP